MQVGLATIATSLQANGGTERMAADEFVAKLDDMAASIEGTVNAQASSLVFECLDQDVQDVLGMVSEIVRCACCSSSVFKKGYGVVRRNRSVFPRCERTL